MQQIIDEAQLQLLVRALLSLKNEEETRSLLSDMCTIREIQDLGQRMEVARLLRAQMTYNDIAAATGASTATISRVNRCLMYGSGGYVTVLERMEKEENHD